MIVIPHVCITHVSWNISSRDFCIVRAKRTKSRRRHLLSYHAGGRWCVTTRQKRKQPQRSRRYARTRRCQDKAALNAPQTREIALHGCILGVSKHHSPAPHQNVPYPVSRTKMHLGTPQKVPRAISHPAEPFTVHQA